MGSSTSQQHVVGIQLHQCRFRSLLYNLQDSAKNTWTNGTNHWFLNMSSNAHFFIFSSLSASQTAFWPLGWEGSACVACHRLTCGHLIKSSKGKSEKKYGNLRLLEACKWISMLEVAVEGYLRSNQEMFLPFIHQRFKPSHVMSSIHPRLQNTMWFYLKTNNSMTLKVVTLDGSMDLISVGWFQFWEQGWNGTSTRTSGDYRDNT